MYTREEVLGMVVGRELDKLIGQHIMQYRLYHYDKDVEENCYVMLVDEGFDSVLNLGRVGERDTEEEAWDDCPHFSTDIAAAWEVVEKFKTYQVTKTHQIKLPNGPEDMYRAIVQANKYVAFAITPSLAICRAALLASLLKED